MPLYGGPAVEVPHMKMLMPLPVSPLGVAILWTGGEPAEEVLCMKMFASHVNLPDVAIRWTSGGSASHEDVDLACVILLNERSSSKHSSMLGIFCASSRSPASVMLLYVAHLPCELAR